MRLALSSSNISFTAVPFLELECEIPFLGNAAQLKDLVIYASLVRVNWALFLISFDFSVNHRKEKNSKIIDHRHIFCAHWGLDCPATICTFSCAAPTQPQRVPNLSLNLPSALRSK